MAVCYEGDLWNDFWAKPGIIDFEPLPLGVVVTVAGSGSEMNGGAVITNEALKVRTGRNIRNLRTAVRNPQDYTARSNLMWNAVLAENRILK